MSLLARRYGTALFLAARERGVVDQVDDHLRRLHAALQDPAVRELATSPVVSATRRREVLLKVVPDAPDLVLNLIETAHRRRREEVLVEVYPEYRGLVMQERGQLDGVVETAQPLPEGELRRLEKLAGDLTGKQVSLDVRENPELIGGVRLHVGNTLFDGSVASALEDLEKQLMRAQVS